MNDTDILDNLFIKDWKYGIRPIIVTLDDFKYHLESIFSKKNLLKDYFSLYINDRKIDIVLIYILLRKFKYNHYHDHNTTINYAFSYRSLNSKINIITTNGIYIDKIINQFLIDNLTLFDINDIFHGSEYYGYNLDSKFIKKLYTDSFYVEFELFKNTTI